MNTKPFFTLRNFSVMMILTIAAAACKDGKDKNEEGTAMDPAKDSLAIAELIKLGEQGSPPVELFFSNPEKAAYRLSPNGEYMAFLSPYENRLNIHVQKIGTDEIVRITEEKDRDISGYFWKNDNRLVFMKDFGGDENYHIVAVDKDGGNLKDLTPFEKVQAGIIDDLEDIPSEMIIQMNKNNAQLFEPYRLNIETGDLTQLGKNEDMMNPFAGWMTDHEGKIRLAIQITGGVNQSILYRETEDAEWRTVLTTNFKETCSPLFFTFDNKNVYASSNLGRDKSAIVEFDLTTGKETKVLYEDADYDVDGLNYSRKRKVLTAITWTGDKREVKFLDPESEKLYNSVKSQLGDLEIVMNSTNKNEDRFIVRTYSDRSLGSYYLYEKVTDKLTLLSVVNEKIKEDEMAAMTPIKYQSRDGLTIHGYLTLPNNVEAKNLPVVINPHGGPWARDAWTFNPEVQLLASRGYAVLQMNFRGSTGYGREFWEASFKQWGQAMQNDISDGVKWLIDQGIADPKRVAIYGGSYGGYATLAGVTSTPELYACAVDYVGVSNLFSFMNTIPPYWKPYLDMFHEMVGDPATDSLMLAANSPALHTDKIICPLFVAQGKNDPRVNIDESDQIVKGLRERDIDVPYMVKDNEGHGFQNEENRFEFYKAMLGFLGKHLKGAES